MTAITGPRAIPFLGASGGLIRFFSDPIRSLMRLRSYGDVVSLAAPDPSLVALFGPEHNRLVLADARRFHNLADPPVKAPPDASMNRITHGLTAMNGDHHRLHRRLLQPAFSRTAIEAHAPSIVDVTDRFLARWQPGEVRDVRADTVELAMLISMRCLFGLEVESEAKALGRLGMLALSGLTDMRNVLFPFDAPFTPLRRYLRVCEEVEARLRVLIERRRSTGAGNDALSMLLRAHDEAGSRLTDDELVGHANVLFVAGHETTASTLAWTLVLLSEHPKVASDVHDELRAVLGDAPITVGDIDRLPLLDRVVKESMRLLPATPFLFMRETQAPLEVGGHVLPQGAKLLLSPLMTHREEALFSEPLKFKPERWEGATFGPFEYLPFGAGPRMCLGATFAHQVLRLVLATVLRRHRVSLVAGARVEARCHGITMGPKGRLPMRLTVPSTGFVATGQVDGLAPLVDFPVAA